MKIVIAGAGEVGTHLAKMLSNEEQDIIIMDIDEKKLAKLESYNLMTYVGSAVSFNDLTSVGVGSADLFIAVTPMETRNMLACVLAKRLGAKKTVARIDNAEFLLQKNRGYFRELGIDNLIYPEQLAAEAISDALKLSWARNRFELMDGELIVLGVKIRSNSQLCGKRLRELSDISSFMHISAIKRNREIIIPRGNDVILDNDIAYIATMSEGIDRVREVCGKQQIETNRVLIVGGNRIAERLAKIVDDDIHIKIIEADEDRCQALADRLPNCNIVQGDLHNTDLLEEEGVSDYDVFITLGESSAVNILGCMTAKAHDVRKTIAEVEDIQYINEAESLNIGTIVNKKLLASSHIFQILLDSDASTSKCLALADAEVAEIVIKEGSKVTKSDVKDLKLSDEMTIAGLVRNGDGQLVTGNTRFMAGDHVVVFCLAGAIHKVEKAFK